MVRNILFFFLLTTVYTAAQVSNVRQTTENGRIIITYDLNGAAEDRFNIIVTATNGNGGKLRPKAVVGNLKYVAPGKARSIWWEPQLEGFAPTGWNIALSAKQNIIWALVQGYPGGDFYISVTEVTFDQYDEFCEETGYKKPDEEFGRGKQPVINVNVADAVAFCEWLSSETGTTIRLPQEYEWEYAARGGKDCKEFEYSGGDAIDEVAWYDDNSRGRTHEVATKKANELGIFDMSGNVWEWCGTAGAIRGGSWYDPDNCSRLSYRYAYSPDYRHSDNGFRVLQKR